MWIVWIVWISRHQDSVGSVDSVDSVDIQAREAPRVAGSSSECVVPPGCAPPGGPSPHTHLTAPHPTPSLRLSLSDLASKQKVVSKGSELFPAIWRPATTFYRQAATRLWALLPNLGRHCLLRLLSSAMRPLPPETVTPPYSITNPPPLFQMHHT